MTHSQKNIKLSKSWSQWFSCHLPTENEERFH